MAQGTQSSVTQLSYSPGLNNCCVTIDGLQLLGLQYGDGNGIKIGHVANWTIKNVEIAGYDDGLLIGPTSVNVTVDSIVCHDVNHHCVYFDYGSPYANYEGQGAAGGDFNFSTDLAAFRANTVFGCSFSGLATLQQSGNSTEPSTVTVTEVDSGSLCYGTELTGTSLGTSPPAFVDGQISGTTGGLGVYVVYNVQATVSTPESITGAPLACQSIPACGASYNAKVLNSAMYGNGNGGYEPLHINDLMNGVVVANNRISFNGGNCLAMQTGVYNAWIENNLCFDNAKDNVEMVIGQSDVSSTLNWNAIRNNIFWSGNPANEIRGAGGAFGGINQSMSYGTNGPYAIPGSHYIKNTTITGNKFVGYYNASTGNAALEFGSISSPIAIDAYPETDTVSNNLLWSTYSGNPTSYAMTIAPNASATWVNGTYPFSGGSACNLTTVESFSQCYPSGNNTFGAPGFVTSDSAMLADWLNPGLYDFGPYYLR